MDVPAALAADLGLLSAAIQDSGGGLEPGLRSLVKDLRRAVGSYLGLTMTIAVDGNEISFTLSEPTEAATSLRIPLPAVAGSPAGSALVLYAATPGAFVDLAADLAWTLALDPSALVLDEDLGMPVSSDGVIGLREHATINRAIGALMERGHSLHSARTELHRRAAPHSGNVPAVAQRILNGLRRPPLPERV